MRTTAICICLALGLAIGSTSAFAQEIPETSHFEKEVPGSRTIVIFVHGILGDGRSTWTNAAAYWPRMLASDPAFTGTDIFVYSYPTGAWATFSIDELAENMRLILTSMSRMNYDNVVFIAHSMGGLVVRNYLLKNRSVAERVKFLYFYSTPTTGSEIAAVISLAAAANPQLNKMKPMLSDDFLADQVRQWNNAKFKLPTYCAYEKRKTFGQQIVSMASATYLCTQPLDPIDANHIDIVKPESPNSITYLAFKAAYNQQISVGTAQGQSSEQPAATTPTAPSAPCLPARMLKALNFPSVPAKDGNGYVVGTVSDISLAVIEICKPPNDRSTKYLLKYGYYNGSGTWRGEQHMNVTLKGDNGFPLKVEVVPIDRSRCIYGGSEPRSKEGDLQGLGYLVQGIEVNVTPVSGVQTGC